MGGSIVKRQTKQDNNEITTKQRRTAYNLWFFKVGATVCHWNNSSLLEEIVFDDRGGMVKKKKKKKKKKKRKKRKKKKKGNNKQEMKRTVCDLLGLGSLFTIEIIPR